MKKVIYTAQFGGKDVLKDPVRNEGFEYVVFTDDPELRSDCYQVVLVDPVHEDPTRNARMCKICAHRYLPEAEYSLWIDGNIDLSAVDLTERFDRYLQHHDLALHAHPVRDCLYEEAEVCCEWGKDDPVVIRRQIKAYRAKGYPSRNGLMSCSILFRRHTPEMAAFQEAWWRELEVHSRRDQLSFNYVAWKLGFGYHIIDGHMRKHNVEGFTLHPHQKSDFVNWNVSPDLRTRIGHLFRYGKEI